MPAFVYVLQCAGGSYSVGSARGETLDQRISEHQAGTYPGHTHRRRPVRLMYAAQFARNTDAIAAERRIKGRSRAKKEALIHGDWERLLHLAKRPAARHRNDRTPVSEPSREEVRLADGLA